MDIKKESFITFELIEKYIDELIDDNPHDMDDTLNTFGDVWLELELLSQHAPEQVKSRLEAEKKELTEYIYSEYKNIESERQHQFWLLNNFRGA